MFYAGREMKVSHEGTGINESDWYIFMGHVVAALDNLSVGEPEHGDVLGFMESLKDDIVD
jgi:hemoglobin